MLYRSLERTAEGLGGRREAAYTAARRALPRARPTSCSPTSWRPSAFPRTRSQMLRFGLRAAFSANRLARLCVSAGTGAGTLRGLRRRTRCSPSRQPLTAALGLIFALTGHVEEWPVARGGSHAIARKRHGVVLREPRRPNRDGPAHRTASASSRKLGRVVLFDTSPEQLRHVSPTTRCPPRYRRPARPLPLRSRGLQARLGARRPDSLARTQRVSRRRRSTWAARRRTRSFGRGAGHVPRPASRIAPS